MIKQDAAKYTDFCHHIEGYGGFSPWLDEYDPLTEKGFAFVHSGSEDNGQFGLGDIDLNFGTTEFSYKDILEKVKKYRDDCKGSMDTDLPEERDYVDELDELVRAIQDWCDKNESKKSDGLPTKSFNEDARNDMFKKARAFLKNLDDLKMFVFDDYFTDDIEGVSQDTYLFDYLYASGGKTLTFGVQFLDNELSSVYVCDDNGEWVDEGTDIDDIMRDPKGWLKSVVSKVPESKKSEGVEALKDKVVSDGTLKPEDLIPKFLNALKHDETAHSKFLKDYPEILEIQSWDDVDDETKSMLVDELTDALNGIAPDGYFFGASEGDGACFGFWKVGNNDERVTTKIETYIGFEDLLRYADAEYLLEDVVDVLSKYYTYEGDGDDIVFDEDQAKGDPEFTIKIEGGDGRADYYYENVFYVHLPSKEASEELADVLGGKLEESKKPESCKDGKKESMERCDSCGAVMTEYDYDRYGGLCKRCRDKGEAKKPEAKKSEALTKDTVVVGTLDSSSEKWIERTLKQIKKKFPNVESDAIGCTITIRGKLADVSAVCDAYPKGVSSLWTDKGGDFLPNAAGDNLDYGEVSKVLSESKKSEGISDTIKMNIDYNTFMRLCAAAAYLDEDEDYWDALWEYYSEMGEIQGSAFEFFDNLFQYTDWADEERVYGEMLDDKYKDKNKSKGECIQAAIDDGDLDAYKSDKGMYLVIQ
ncbi:MAG: hypothetical protein IKT27_03755 [Clostridia bacterium]|nr:hypothetical protein [Clostridia bacterium]